MLEVRDCRNWIFGFK